MPTSSQTPLLLSLWTSWVTVTILLSPQQLPLVTIPVQSAIFFTILAVAPLRSTIAQQLAQGT